MEVDKSKLTNAMGNPLTKSLFLENWMPTDVQPVYTLKDKDHTIHGVTYPSLYRLYMEEEDLTEYQFANKYLLGWDQWQRICKAPWFQEYIDRWREELHLKISARALNQIKATAKTNTRDAFQAQRYLLEKGWIPKTSKDGKGRPSNEKIKEEAKKMAMENSILDNDLKRIGIH